MSYSHLKSSSSPAPSFTDEDARLLFDAPLPPYRLDELYPLRKCFVVPQTGTGIDSPFARAYNAELESSGIQQTDWLKFCDGLNIAMTASPPLRVLDVAGKVIGFVPYHWAMIAGPVIQAGAAIGAHAVSKGLTDRYISMANKTYFAPRGLRVRLCKTDAMRQIVGLDPKGTNNHETLKTMGNTAERIGLRLPLIRKAIVMFHPAPAIDTSRNPDVTQRRVAALQDCTLPLDYNVPPPTTPRGYMDQVSAGFVKIDTWKKARATNQTDKARMQLAQQQGANWQMGRGGLQGGALGGQMVRDRISARARGDSSDISKLRTQVAIADRQEAARTVAILWIVVMNADKDAQFSQMDLDDNKSVSTASYGRGWEQESIRENDGDYHAWRPMNHDTKW
ncbi:hypothetical protein FRB94_011057 [Tulasnella sp. JGI-2019a]|nr:hypothetical protein FRB94_011057 [Tulasnella sp. JGI-2019a]KAG9003133.1 hypothetical protein FRB93_011213 [Tulasnella sp. JGI-2019a]KAG9034003.1 hypothetical protein FRB95_013976 [Tulasnella sp. JGI-2019a]